MKKTLLTLALLCVACISAFAGGIKVTGGDKKIFKHISGNAVLEFIFDNATFADKMPLQEDSRFQDIEHVKEVAMNGFKQDFNDECENVKVVDSAADAQYKITLKVTKMDQYVKITGFIPAPATKTWGVMTISDLKTGEILTTVEVNAVNGGANPSPDGCISDSFEELGEKVGGLQ